MGKTQLFSRLSELATHAVWQRAPSVSRRGLLGYGLAAAAGCGPSKDPPVTTTNTQRRVAVIGAGIAGLHCAYRLHQAGVDVTVYEANDRLGGRIFTGRNLFPDPRLVCELGAEFIGSDQICMLALADEFSLVLEPVTSDLPDTYWVKGVDVGYDKLAASFVSVAPALLSALSAAENDDRNRKLLDNTTLADFLANNVPEAKYPELLRLMNVAFRVEFGLETDVLSALDLWRLFPPGSDDSRPFGGPTQRFRAAAGNDGFVRALAQPLRIVTDRRLASLSLQKSGSYQLILRSQALNGFLAEAEYVVLALPFSVLRTLNLDEFRLSAEKRLAIEKLGYGSAVTLVSAFNGRPWRDRYQRSGSALSDLPFQTVWDSTRGNSSTHATLTNSFAGEAGTLVADTDVTTNMNATLAQLEQVWGPITGDYIGARRVDWLTSPFSRGSTSAYLARQRTSFGGHERGSEGNLYFCGEHCSENWKGTLEGAARTSALTAQEILKNFGLPLPEGLKTILEQVSASSGP